MSFEESEASFDFYDPRTRGERPPQPSAGTVLNAKYDLVRLIDQGGMGSVYEALQRPIGRLVAIKILHQELADQPEALKRFEQEARFIAKLQHPNVVTLFDFGVTETGLLFLVMERLSGLTLRRELDVRGPLAIDRSITIIRQICRALSAAHAAGIVHRDLKPSNVQLVPLGRDGESVKVFDFGVAKVLTQGEGEAQLTGRSTLGTPRYMAPEQMRGDAVDPRADLYALGVLFFEILTGRPPFVDREYAALLYKHVHEPAPRVSEVCPKLAIDPGLEAVIAKALEKDPKKRFQSADELESALEAWVATSLSRAASSTHTSGAPVDRRTTVAFDAPTRPEAITREDRGPGVGLTASSSFLAAVPEITPSATTTTAWLPFVRTDPTLTLPDEATLEPSTAPASALTLRARRRQDPKVAVALALPLVCLVLGSVVLTRITREAPQAPPVASPPPAAARLVAPSPTTAAAASERPPKPAPPEAPSESRATSAVILAQATSLRARIATTPAAVLGSEVVSGELGPELARALLSRSAEIGRCFESTQKGRNSARKLRLTVVVSDGKQTTTARPLDAASGRFLECLTALSPPLQRDHASARGVSVAEADVGRPGAYETHGPAERGGSGSEGLPPGEQRDDRPRSSGT